MSKVTIEIDRRQIEYAIEQLPITEKIEILEGLAKGTREERWQKLLSKIRKRYNENPISDVEINQICEKVRQGRYERKAKSSN